MEAEIANATREGPPSAVEKWLGIARIGIAVFLALAVLNFADDLRVGLGSAHGDLARRFPGYPLLFRFEVFQDAVVLLLAALACYYFYTWKGDTPPAMIVLGGAAAALAIPYFVMACVIFGFSLPLLGAGAWTAIALGAGVWWIPYFLMSKSAKAAFTQPSPKVFALAYRELSGYFISPMAYIVGGMFLLASSLWFFHAIFVPGLEASLRPLFEAMAFIMVFAVPLLTMRLVSEEMRSGTIETLMTAPVTDTEVILGKFLGVMALYLVLLACTGVFLALMGVYGQPDAGVAVMGYVGMILLGSAYVAVGIFASTLTPYQLVAAIVATAILALFAILMQLVVAHGPEPLNEWAARVNAMTYFKDFSRGMFTPRGLVYFLSAAALFLFLSVKLLESRRWR
jgi:ABC-2 type transport system permease protein